MDVLPYVVLFGDSLTQRSFSSDGGWGSKIADALPRQCDVVNRGYSGYNTSWCKLILPQILTTKNASNVAAVTVFLGANDSSDGELNPQQHVPLTEYEENLIHMTEYLQKIGIDKEKLIIIGPPPVDIIKWAKECEIKGRPQPHDNEVRGRYADACRNAATRAAVSHVELYTSMMKNKDWTEYLNDGLHFSSLGSQFVFDQLWPVLREKVDALPIHLPLWDAVDYNNPQTSFLNQN